MATVGGVPNFRIFTVYTLISVNLSKYEVFGTKVCDFRQEWYKLD